MVLHFNTRRACELSCSVMSDSLRPHGLKPTVLLCPCNSPGKLTGAGCAFLLHGSSQPRDQTLVSWVAGGFLTTGPPGKPLTSASVLTNSLMSWGGGGGCVCVCVCVCVCADGFLEKWNAVEYKDVHIFHLLLKPSFLLYTIRKP